jgi:esterase
MVQLATSSVGDGPALTVLLHGFLGTGRNLRTLALHWAARDPGRKFLLPDLLGHGDSPPLPPGAGSRELAAAVLETVATTGNGGPATWVGHSLGARVALAAAQLDAKSIREVIMLDMSPGPADAPRSRRPMVLDALLHAPSEVDDRRVMRADLVERGLEPALADWLLMNLSQQDGHYRWRIDRNALAELHDRLFAENLWPVVESRLVKVRCIRGERSSYVTEADAERMQTAGCPVVTLPGAGHYVHVDALEPLVEALVSGG